MKTRHFFLTLVALLAFAGNAMAQKDITSQYITNATLSNGTTGWTVSNFNTPQQGNNTVGYASEAYAGWGDLEKTAYSLTQNITLPAGSYRLVNYSFFRQGEAYNTDNTKSLAYLKAGSNQVAIKTLGSITAAGYANSQAEGANCFDSKMYRNVLEFTLDAQTTLEIGITGTFDAARSWCIAGMFELFDMNDLASVSSPTDMTYAITNPGFEYRNTNGWTTTGDPGGYANGAAFSYKAGIGMVEKWSWVTNGNYTGSLKQTLTGLENGLYEVTVYAGNIEQQNSDAAGTGMYLVANSDQTAIGTSGQYTVRTTVTDGTLNLGIDMNNATGNWVVWDRFGLLFYGAPLAAYQDLLDAKIAAAQALYSTLKSGPLAYLQGVVAANNNENDTFTTEAEFNTAVSNIEAAITQVTNLDYSAYDSYRALIASLSSGAEASTELTTFNNAVDAADAAIAVPYTQANLNAVIPTQIANLRTAGLTYISSVDGQFDITFLASQTYSDWKKKDGSAAGVVGDVFLTNRPASVPSFAESYEETCATTGTVLYQTIADLPAGYYQVSMYAAAMYTSGRGFDTEATEGDADRTYAFAGDLNDASSILRTGAPISFATARDFTDLTILDVNVHLTGSGQTNDLTFGLQKDENGSNWHFAQIASVVYSSTPDLTNLQNTRDQLVAEAQGLLAISEQYLTSAQQTALQNAITAGNNASTFEALNTATLTTLPDAINTANQQIAQAKAGIAAMRTALERFELDYNLVDGTDYRRVTMSAQAWTDLLTDVNAVTTALDDLSQASNYTTLAQNLEDQMDATDVSIRLFKSYQAMLDGVAEKKDNSDASALATAYTTYRASAYMDTDSTEQAAITALNDAFVTWAATQSHRFTVNGFLGENLNFNTARTTPIKTDDNCSVYDIVGWEEDYANLVAWSVLDNSNSTNANMLYIRSNWTATAVKLNVMKEKMLPVGKYKLSLSWNSTLGNMVNNSAYVLDGTSTTIGQEVSSATTLEYEFEVTDYATPFDIIIGLTKASSDATNHPAQILVDDIVLTYVVETPFQLALEAAREALDDATSGTAVYYGLHSAITEYEDYEGHEDEFENDAARTAATNVLTNAKTIADNNGVATSLVVNGDFSNTELTNYVPTGWTAYSTAEGDTWIRTQDGAQVFNYWAGSIPDWEFNQTLNDLPKGVYRFSIDMGTAGFEEGGAAEQLAFIIGDATGASQQVNTLNTAESRAFGTYTCATELTNGHTLTIGVRSVKFYLQCKNVVLTYLGDPATSANQAETDASYLRQDYMWWGRGALEYDASRADWANAKDVVIFPTQKNQLIKAAAADQFANTTNKIVNGTCANLVITDGSPLQITTGFTATAASYERTISNDFATVLLPYPISSTTDRKFYVLASLEGNPEDASGIMHFESVEILPAGTPGLLHHSEGGEMTFSGTNVSVVSTATKSSEPLTGWTFQGEYTATELDATEDDAPDYYYVSGNKFYHATGTLTINPFRTYFIYTGGGAVAERFDIMLDDQEATAITGVETSSEVPMLLLTDKGGMTIVAQADLNYQVVSVNGAVVASGQLAAGESKALSVPAGVYVVNGKKVYIK